MDTARYCFRFPSAEFQNFDPYTLLPVKLTISERELIRKYPVQAIKIWANSSTAAQAAANLFPSNTLLNGQGDALRHAYFNALNASDVNPAIAKLFSDAHESEVPSILKLEKNMDILNNAIGNQIGSSMPGASDQAILNAVLTQFNAGAMWHISPLNHTTSRRYDGNGDGVQDCSTCLNGILPTSKLIPSNQTAASQ